MSKFMRYRVVAERTEGVRFARKRFSWSVSKHDLVPELPSATCIGFLLFLAVRKRMWAGMKISRVRVVRVRGVPEGFPRRCLEQEQSNAQKTTLLIN